MVKNKQKLNNNGGELNKMKEKSKVVTVYDLLTLMKNGEIPKKIKYNDIIYNQDEEYKGYLADDDWDLFYKNKDMSKMINDNVYILSEENENNWNDIENDMGKYFIRNEYGQKCYLTKHSIMIANKINKLIENQEYIKSRLDNIKDEVVFDYWKDKVVGKDE